MDEISNCPSLAVFHGDIDSDIFFVDFKLEIFENMDVVHADEGIDFLDDVLFLFGRNGWKGYLLDDDVFLSEFILSFEEVALFTFEDDIFLFQHLQRSVLKF